MRLIFVYHRAPHLSHYSHAGVGVYNRYAGEGGAKPIINGIPYNQVESHPTTDYCWQRINYYYQGVNNKERLRLFHMTCPESMTNLDVHLGPNSCSSSPTQG